MTSVTAARTDWKIPENLRTIVIAGVAGAAIDALYFSTAVMLHGKSPVKVLQNIASFWFGARSAELGPFSAITGAATHVGLAIIMAAGFFLLSRKVEFLRSSPVAGGIAYGLFLYAVMYLVVMPLRWPTIYPRWDSWRSVLDIGVHLVIGIAFAFIFRARAFDPSGQSA